LDEEAFRRRFAGSPVKRTGRDRFLRNVLIAAANARDTSLVPRIEPLLGDRSPLVRAMAVWALSKLAAPHLFSSFRHARLAGEEDAAVRQEWLRP
jgi:epoxyqueuosine reductase